MFFGCLPCCDRCPRYADYTGFEFDCSYRLEWGSFTAGNYAIPSVDVTASLTGTTNSEPPGTATWQAVQYPDGTIGTQTLSLSVAVYLGSDSPNGFLVAATAGIDGSFTPSRWNEFRFQFYPCGITYSTRSETDMLFRIYNTPTSYRVDSSLLYDRTLGIYATPSQQQTSYYSADDSALKGISPQNTLDLSYAAGLRQENGVAPADGVDVFKLESTYTAQITTTNPLNAVAWAGNAIGEADVRETFTISLLTGTRDDGTVETLFPWGFSQT